MNWKWDISIIGHAAEAAGFSVIMALILWQLSLHNGDYDLFGLITLTLSIGVWSFQAALVLTSAFMLWYYIGREKRDCETGWHDAAGNRMKAGDMRAWYRMWLRPKNILDMVGPILIHILAWLNYIFN